MDENGFYRCEGFNVAWTLDKIKRAHDCLAPTFEAFSNALDAIREREETFGEKTDAFVKIEFEFSSAFQEGACKQFVAETIQDSGVGFNDVNFARFLSLNDRSKGALNKGSGRVQYVKAFARADFESVFKEGERAKKRRFTLSADRSFLERNAFAQETAPVEIADETRESIGSTLRLIAPFTDSRRREIEESTVDEIKGRLLERFFLRLNASRQTPRVEILFRVNGVETERATIDASDLIKPRAVVPFEVSFKRLSKTGSERRFIPIDKIAKFEATVFTTRADRSTRNFEAFVCRGEFVEDAKLGLANADETFDGLRYVVAIASAYIDERVSDARDGAGLPRDRDFEDAPLLGDEASAVSVEDVRKEARDACAKVLPELAAKKKELARKVERIGERFGFPKSALAAIQKKLPLNASTKNILKKLYDKEASNAVREDDAIADALESVKELDPNSDAFQEKTRELSTRLFELLPSQNKNALAHYFARRKIVLELLEDALARNLAVQTKEGRRQEESALHNVLFKRGSRDAASSNLWVFNEEYVYFSGASEVAFEDVAFEGKKILAPLEQFSKEDGKFIRSKAKNRPDILLYPEEKKCLIVELKRPGVDLAQHAHQIYRYAYVLFNYCAQEFQFDQFYAFLIGGEFDPEGIRAVDPAFREAEKFGYMYATRPIASRDARRQDGELYAEIHSYRTILERAKARNKTFLDILLNESEIS